MYLSLCYVQATCQCVSRLSELFCVVLCTEAVHSHKHTYMSSSYSSLDWVVSLDTFHCA